MHSLYREMILYPPAGYQFITQGTGWDKVSNLAARTNVIYFFQRKMLSKIIPIKLTKAYIDRFKKIPKDADLTYSAAHLVFRKEPWVVDLEFVTQFIGPNDGPHTIRHFKKYKTIVEEMLRSEYCKKIMPWTDAGRKTILWNLNCEGFEHKIEMVPLAVPGKNFIKRYNKGVIKLLFTGSANIPKDFEIKGGKEVLEAFTCLTKKYDNLELVIRSYVPRYIKERYKEFENIKNVLAKNKIEFNMAEITMIPETTLKVGGKDAQQVIKLMEELDDHDDIQKTYANFDISEKDLKVVISQ